MKRLLLFVSALFCAIVFHAAAQPFTLITKGDLATDLSSTNGASWVDYDGDGDLDLFLTCITAPFPFSTNYLYRNDGNDTFTRITTGELTNLQILSYGNAWGDMNNDGLPDVFTGNAFTRLGSFVYRNRGAGRFTRQENYVAATTNVLSFSAAWGDYDNNGLLDLVVLHPAGFVTNPDQTITSNFLFHNDSLNAARTPFFSRVRTEEFTRLIGPFTNPTWADYDQDGDIDLFIGAGPADGTFKPDYHYKNMLKETGRATFERITAPQWAKDSLDGQVWNWIDYDNDGDLDAYVTNWGATRGGKENNLYRNDGNGAYTRITEGAIVTDKAVSLANVWADFDNDGDLDAYVGNGAGSLNRYYQNNGNGSFTSITTGHFVESTGNTWGVATGDYDNDGDVDLIVTRVGGGTSAPSPRYLYRNDADKTNNWLKILPVGTRANRMGFGTRIKLTATINGRSITQYREIGADATFLGSNDTRAHFGIGRAAMIDRVEVLWNTGTVDTLRNIAPNRIITVTEGRGITASLLPTSVAANNASQEGVILRQNAPNPFSATTSISYYLPQAVEVVLTVHDITGTTIATLSVGKQSAGEHTVEFNPAQQSKGSQNLASGALFYTLKAGNTLQTRKMVMNK